MATVETLFKITAAVLGSNALKDFAGQIDKASSNGQKLERTLKQGSMALKAFAYSEAVQGVKRLVSESINLGAKIDEVNQKTGVSVELLGRWYGAMDQAGMGLDNVAKAAIEANKSISAAQEAGSKQAAAFAALGIKTTDASGRLRSAEEILFEMADRFSETEDGAAKTAVAVALLGKSGADMIPVLNKGAEEIQRLGIAVGPEFAANSAKFNDNMSKIRMQFSQLSVDVANELLPGLISISDGFEKNNTAVKLLVGTIKVLETSFIGLSTLGSYLTIGIGEGFAKVGVEVDGLIDKIKALGSGNFKALGDIERRVEAEKKAIKELAVAEAKAITDRNANTVAKVWDANLGQGSAANPGAAPAAAPRQKEQINFNASASADAAKAQRAADEWLLKQREALETLKQEAEYIGRTSVEIQKLKDARQFESEVAEKAREMTKSQAEAFKKQAEEINKARQAVIDYNYEQARTFGAGAAEFFSKYSEAATDTATQVKSALEGAFRSAEDALVNFTMTGKLNFKDFARSVISDLIRIQIQRSILAPLSSWLGGFFPGGGAVTASANGNIMTDMGPLPLKKYAKGGIARTPQVSIFGEGRMPEAYVPLPDGRSIPVTMRGAAGGSNVGDVYVTVNMTGNGQGSTQTSGGRASEFGRAVAAAVKAQIIEEQRPGGLLAGA